VNQPNDAERLRHAPRRDWLKSIRYALQGLSYAWRTERNFRLEVLLASVALTVTRLLNADLVPVLLCCALVLSLELVNTALEALVDLVSPTFHPLARVVKDVAAGAVLIAGLLSVAVGATVWWRAWPR
jgi:diacylglycerol kinase (ATP)